MSEFPGSIFPVGNVIPFFEVLRLGEHIKRKSGRAKPGYLSTAFPTFLMLMFIVASFENGFLVLSRRGTDALML